MVAATARGNSVRGQSNDAARPQKAAPVLRPALSVQPRRPSFLSALLRALSAFGA
jgi:hypothetical protein